MPPELEDTQTKAYSEEEITKILNTAKATRAERDEAAKKAKELETQLAETNKQLESIKGLDPKRYQELEALAQTYEDQKLEEQRKFGDLKERWQGERTTLQQQITNLQTELKTTRITNALEKAFYAVGGKAGKDDEGLTYFDLLRDRAMQYIDSDESGKLVVINPQDKTRMVTDKGTPYTVEDLMAKFRTGGPTTSLFEPVGNGAGGGMQRSNGTGGTAMQREQLMKLPRAERLTQARKQGI